jgi:nucleobase:cation symporter-1, NCS1 family
MTDTSNNLSAIESRHIDYVPEKERHGKVWRQGPFWFLGNFQPFTVAIGFSGPLLGLNLGWSAVAAVIGVLFGTIFMAAHAAQGPKLGLPQMIQSRAQFGYVGVIIPLLASTFTFVAFLVVDTVILKIGIKNLWGWNTQAVAVGLMVLTVVVAIYGHDWIHRVFVVLFFASFPFWILTSLGIFSYHVHLAASTAMLGYNTAGFFAMFALAASYNITYAPYVSDYTRYLPTATKTSSLINSVFWGGSLSPIWLIPLGSWLAINLNTADPIQGLNQAGNHVFAHCGTILVVLATLALVATMGMGAYSGMLSVITAVDSYRPVATGAKARVGVIILLGLIAGFFGVLFNVASTALYDALTIMLYILAPWTAINLVDFYAVRHGKFAITDFFTPSGIYGRWGTQGLIAYFVGILVEVPFMYIPSYYTSWGVQKLNMVDISWIIGLFVSGILYFAITRGIDRASEAKAVAASDAALAQGTEVR